MLKKTLLEKAMRVVKFMILKCIIILALVASIYHIYSISTTNGSTAQPGPWPIPRHCPV
jgi:hypothetical protein